MRVWETSTRARVKLEQLVGPRRRRQQVVDWNGTDRLTRRSSTRNQQTPCTVKVHAPLWLCSQNLLINAAQCQTLFFVCLFVCSFVLFFAASGISMHACLPKHAWCLCLEAPWADWISGWSPDSGGTVPSLTTRRAVLKFWQRACTSEGRAWTVRDPTATNDDGARTLQLSARHAMCRAARAS